MVSIYSKKDENKIRQYLGDKAYERQKASAHFCAVLPDGAYFLAFYFVDVASQRGEGERIRIYCGQKELAIFAEHPRAVQAGRELSQQDAPCRALFEYLHMLTAQDIEALEQLEIQIEHFENELFTAKELVRGAAGRIDALLRRLHPIHRNYDQLEEVIEALADSEGGVVDEREAGRFAALARRVRHLGSTGVYLSECIARTREAYQAQVDIEQNEIMKIFTVLSAVFLPLTLIAGWYGMNFSMPEYGWALGYPMVIVLSIAVCTACILFFRRKKWF